jgi:D-alanyl-D-alanine carboxypeptidase
LAAMRIRLLVPVLAVAAAVTPTAASARPDAAAPPSLRQLARKIVDVGSPGSIVLVRDGRGTRAGAAGFANLRTRERLRPDHAFRVGSITKTFVAAVVLQLAAEGVLGLDDSIERWLPGAVPNGGAITLRQLLNHTSGVYNYTDDPALLRAMARNPLEVWTPSALVALATRHAPLFRPGAGWAYSNTGYILLGLAIERATGTSLAEQLRRRIIEPLGLTRTSFPDAPTLAAPFAHGYLPPGNGLFPTPRGRPADVTVWSPSWAWAAGAIVSTAGDLARFYDALLGGRLLAPAQLASMRTTVPAGGGSESYGLGLMAVRLRCGAAWGHGGAVFGYTALAFASEDGSRTAVVLVNTSVTSRVAVPFERALVSALCR